MSGRFLWVLGTCSDIVLLPIALSPFTCQSVTVAVTVSPAHGHVTVVEVYGNEKHQVR